MKQMLYDMESLRLLELILIIFCFRDYNTNRTRSFGSRDIKIIIFRKVDIWIFRKQLDLAVIGTS